MKRSISLIIITLCLAASAVKAQSKMTLADSAAYAIGMDLARMVKSFDSTLNVATVVMGLQDSFGGKAKFDEKGVNAAIQNFMQAKQNELIAQEQQQMNEAAAAAAAYLAEIEKQEGVSKTKSGLLYKIEKLGGDRLPQEGDMVTVHYTLRTTDSKVIDSSYNHGEPMTYPNIKGQMIQGFTEGLQLLGEGGKATLYLPPSLGYGERGTNGIAPNSVLIFDVSLLAITPRK